MIRYAVRYYLGFEDGIRYSRRDLRYYRRCTKLHVMGISTINLYILEGQTTPRVLYKRLKSSKTNELNSLGYSLARAKEPKPPWKKRPREPGDYELNLNPKSKSKETVPEQDKPKEEPTKVPLYPGMFWYIKDLDVAEYAKDRRLPLQFPEGTSNAW